MCADTVPFAKNAQSDYFAYNRHMEGQHDIEKTFQPLRRLSLTDAEHEAMRKELQLFMAAHPARMPAYSDVFEYVRTTFSHIEFFTSTRYTSAAVAFALVLCVGVGTSYAAEGAIPGDALYSVKVGVNEGVRAALATTPKAKAEWSTTVASRRLEEAETLAASGALTALTSAEIKQSLEASAKSFDDNVAVLATEDDTSSDIADVQSGFEAALNAHAEVLVALTNAKPETGGDIAPILASVQIRANGAAASREIAERVFARTDSQRVKHAADAKKATAKKEVRAIRVLAARAGADASSKASSSAFQAEQSIELGDQNLRDGDYGFAFGAFQAAIRTAHETKVNVDADERLRGKVNLSMSGNSGPTLMNASAKIGTTTEDDSRGGHSGEDH